MRDVIHKAQHTLPCNAEDLFQTCLPAFGWAACDPEQAFSHHYSITGVPTSVRIAVYRVNVLMCVCSVLKTSSRPPFKASAKTSPHPCKIASRQPSRHPLPPLGATMHPSGQNTQSLVCWLTSLVPSQGLLVPTVVATDSGSGPGIAG